jgi:hypothetical protein
MTRQEKFDRKMRWLAAFLLACLCAFAFPHCVHPAEITTTDIMLEGTWIGLHTIDWMQTRYIAIHPDQYEELNPVLGHHPGIGKVNAYFAAGMVLHPLVSYLLPKPYRTWWQGITIGMSGACVGKNLSIGVRMKW